MLQQFLIQQNKYATPLAVKLLMRLVVQVIVYAVELAIINVRATVRRQNALKRIVIVTVPTNNCRYSI